MLRKWLFRIAPKPRDPTDIARWSDPASLDAAWDVRAKFAAGFVAPAARILDLGCGAMALRHYLPPGCTYVGCDLVARDPETIVCNLNAGEFPDEAARGCDVIVMLGLLGYVADVPALLRRIAEHKVEAIFAYVLGGQSKKTHRVRLERAGWINSFTCEELERMLRASGFRTLRIESRIPGEVLFHVASR